MPNWRDLAACLDHDPEKWFSDLGKDRSTKFGKTQQQDAKDICLKCPVQTECLVNSEGSFGIWGGYDTEQRGMKIR